ncbi:hypothetical protein KP509_03G095300 [Ceratopteris richardii]|nr:hypothetical protein KP509_03G095300 [Ceratopteris richardii]
MILGQALKPFTAALRGKGLNWKLLISSGGMPSSHSASVTAACTAIAMDRGLADPLFGLAVVFAGIVMYDAQGVRRAVGKHAEVINTLVVGYDYQSLTGIQTDRQLETQSGDDLTSRGFLTDESSPNAFSAAGKQRPNETFSINDRVRNGRSYQRPQNFIEAAKKLPSVEAGDVDIAELSDSDGWRHIPLKESVGHTKAEVVVGGLWGIFCTIVLSTVFSH